jgi:ABC-2 type transport system ATP-binding protein
VIVAKELYKLFRIYKKPPGLIESFKSLFHREYETNTAISNFNLDIERGEIVGLLGPNGAGKTTLMKMFTGIIVPSSGILNVLNHIPSNRDLNFRKKIALVMGQKSQLWWDLPTMDSLQLLQRYYEIPENLFRQRVNDLSDILEVTNLLHIHVRKLSLGERMKVELIASLLHQPEILFLDEPTLGLDIVAQRNVREFIKHYQQKYNTTLILTSHYMADVSALCQRIILILKGEKKFDGTLKEFETLQGPEKNVMFLFSQKISIEADIWKRWDAQWNNEQTQVNVRISESELREATIYILQHYPVIEFQTEALPIERVLLQFSSRNTQLK